MNFDNITGATGYLDNQIKNVMNVYYQHPRYRETGTYYNFRCDICGDSKKSKSKKRAYILKSDNRCWTFYCHNCGNKMSAANWLKDYYQIYYKEYLRDLLSQRDEQSLNKTVEVKVDSLADKKEKKETKHFVPIITVNEQVPIIRAKFLCEERKIPKEVWSRWYVAMDGIYKNRIIIPFYDHLGKTYYYQARSIYSKMEPKYLSRKDPENKMNSIYNYYLVDDDMPVIIFEGMIDSLFIDNSIAITGLKINNEVIWKRLQNFKYRYFLLDSDKDGRRISQELLLKGEFVFLWSKFIKEYKLPQREKWDINDVYLFLNRDKKFSFDELLPFFSNNFFDKVHLIM